MSEALLKDLSLEAAVSVIKEKICAIGETEFVPLLSANGRILAEDIYSSINNPPFDRSPIDGYACKSKDLLNASKDRPAKLKVLLEVDAGDCSGITVKDGECIRIMTGAPIPAGCDCTVRQEDTDYNEETVSVFTPVKAFQNYCYTGEDFKIGDQMLKKDDKVSFAEIGTLAALGIDKVKVYRIPKVYVYTTGDEIVMPGTPLSGGKIYNSNYYMIISRLNDCGVNPIVTGTLSDDVNEVGNAILSAVNAGADLVITSGGVSVGKKDILHEALDIAHADKIFWGIQMKPGSPTIFSMCKGVPVISLSGNPFGVAVHTELIIRPALSKLMHDDSIEPVQSDAVMGEGFEKGRGKFRRVLRAINRNGKIYFPEGLHSSGVIASMRGCNCFLDIVGGPVGPLNEGEEVKIWML